MKHKTFNHVYLSAFFKCISYYDYFTSPGLFLLSLEDEWNLNLTGLQLIHVGEQWSENTHIYTPAVIYAQIQLIIVKIRIWVHF